MILLIQSMSYLLFMRSIDYADYIEQIDQQNLAILNNIQEDEKDFNYNELSTEEISVKKFPFINCNRKIFCNSDGDLLELDNYDLGKEIIEKSHKIVKNLSYIVNIIKDVAADKCSFNSSTNMHVSSYGKSIVGNKGLKLKIQSLTKSMINEPGMIKYNAYDFLLEAEKFIDESSNIDLFKLFFGIRPSVHFNYISTEKDLKVSDIKCYLRNIGIIYDRVQIYINNLKGGIFKTERTESYIPCACFLKEFILLKWIIEVERAYIFKFFNNLENFNHMLIYSINSNDILVREVRNIIQNVVNGKLDKTLKYMGSISLPTSSCIHNSLAFKCYVFEHSNGKTYRIKVFDLKSNGNVPSGLSTAYLNCKGGFESLGFMAVKRISDSQFEYLFLSVDEEIGFYVSTSDLGFFKRNAIQAFYFLLYIIELMYSLNVYKTKLMLYDNQQPYHTFAVDNRDSKKWRFRLEYIGDFKCFKNQNLYMNHEYLVFIIDSLYNCFKNKILLDFFKHLKNVTDELKNSNNENYFTILTTMINDGLVDLKDILNQ